MRDYTYQDMLKMQEEAAKRVREMKKRAAIAVEEETPPAPAPAMKMNLPDEVKRFSYPVELPEETPEEKEQTTLRTGENTPHEGLLSIITHDKDAMLVLSLLAVLKQEETDYMTSLALLYLLL